MCSAGGWKFRGSSGRGGFAERTQTTFVYTKAQEKGSWSAVRVTREIGGDFKGVPRETGGSRSRL